MRGTWDFEIDSRHLSLIPRLKFHPATEGDSVLTGVSAAEHAFVVYEGRLASGEGCRDSGADIEVIPIRTVGRQAKGSAARVIEETGRDETTVVLELMRPVDTQLRRDYAALGAVGVGHLTTDIGGQ